jgi:hypothetical protein
MILGKRHMHFVLLLAGSPSVVVEPHRIALVPNDPGLFLQFRLGRSMIMDTQKKTNSALLEFKRVGF